ncbi:hypothetical protein HK104_004735 [Borealophlyctis nickersoniae]|nr:hypothetical protein HK104_004735 [Borealophlyctis nickersoniae]
MPQQQRVSAASFLPPEIIDLILDQMFPDPKTNADLRLRQRALMALSALSRHYYKMLMSALWRAPYVGNNHGFRLFVEGSTPRPAAAALSALVRPVPCASLVQKLDLGRFFIDESMHAQRLIDMATICCNLKALRLSALKLDVRTLYQILRSTPLLSNLSLSGTLGHWDWWNLSDDAVLGGLVECFGRLDVVDLAGVSRLSKIGPTHFAEYVLEGIGRGRASQINLPAHLNRDEWVAKFCAGLAARPSTHPPIRVLLAAGAPKRGKRWLQGDTGCYMTDAQLTLLVPYLRHVHTLDITGASINHTSLTLLLNTCSNLTHLNIAKTSGGDASLAAIVDHAPPTLTTLIATNVPSTEQAIINLIRARGPTLNTLDIGSQTPLATQSTLLALAFSCPTLERVRLPRPVLADVLMAHILAGAHPHNHPHHMIPQHQMNNLAAAAAATPAGLPPWVLTDQMAIANGVRAIDAGCSALKCWKEGGMWCGVVGAALQREMKGRWAEGEMWVQEVGW